MNINPIDKIVNDLRDERQRRINAYNSNNFCDNKTLDRNIKILTKGIVAMNNEMVLNIISKEEK